MAGVVVVSDSSAYIPRRLAEVNGIVVLQQYGVGAVPPRLLT